MQADFAKLVLKIEARVRDAHRAFIDLFALQDLGKCKAYSTPLLSSHPELL